MRSLVQQAGWIVPVTEQLYYVSDRPVCLSVNQDDQLHAEAGVAALVFADGISLYARSGQLVPKGYGSNPEDDWQSQWVVDETNPHLKQILINGIGYGRLAMELESTQLDARWEYELLHFDAAVMGTSLALLKRTELDNEVEAVVVPIEITDVLTALAWLDAQPGGGWPDPLTAQSSWWSCTWRTPSDRPPQLPPLPDESTASSSSSGM